MNEKQEEQIKKRELQKKKNATKANALNKSWEVIRKEKAVKELVRFIEVEINRYRGVGHDGVGYDKEGEVVRFTNEQRISYMDKATGLEEILHYIERHMKE